MVWPVFKTAMEAPPAAPVSPDATPAAVVSSAVVPSTAARVEDPEELALPCPSAALKASCRLAALCRAPHPALINASTTPTAQARCLIRDSKVR